VGLPGGYAAVWSSAVTALQFVPDDAPACMQAPMQPPSQSICCNAEIQLVHRTLSLQSCSW
jgi:hypothetical protein